MFGIKNNTIDKYHPVTIFLLAAVLYSLKKISIDTGDLIPINFNESVPNR